MRWSGIMTLVVPFLFGCLLLAISGQVLLVLVCIAVLTVSTPLFFLIARRRANRSSEERTGDP